MIVNLKGQRQVAVVMLFSVGFFIFGVSQDANRVGDAGLIAKQVVKAPTRGTASE